MNAATRNLIKTHLNDDVHSISLSGVKNSDIDLPLAIRQITGKQKVKNKIPTFYRCENLLYPVKLPLEQSSSEITAKHKLQSCEGRIIVDLTGGFGVDSYFLSFNFEKVIYVERQAELCKLAKHNFQALGRDNIEIVNNTAENELEKIEKADWIFIDPARRTETGKKLILLSDCEPNVIQLSEKLLSKSKNIMIKLSPMVDITAILKDLPSISEIQIIAINNECKEVVAIIHKNQHETIKIQAINYPNNKPVEIFEYRLNEEQSANANYTNRLEKYLYEANAAILKSGAFKLIGERFQVNKLHINSHLYTSDKLIADFPGRVFTVVGLFDFGKESLKKLRSNLKTANLSVRNFPLPVNDLRKKLNLKEGGDDFLFATILSNNKKILIHVKKT